MTKYPVPHLQLFHILDNYQQAFLMRLALFLCFNQVYRLTCKQSRADSTIFDCLVSKAKRNGRITKSASEPSSVCPASARVAAAACPVLGFAGDETGVASTDLESVSLGVDGSPSDALSGAAELILSTHNQKRHP